MIAPELIRAHQLAAELQEELGVIETKLNRNLLEHASTWRWQLHHVRGLAAATITRLHQLDTALGAHQTSATEENRDPA